MSSPFRAEPDEQELRDAIDAGDITIALQPLVNVPSGEIVRLEALARWSHPTRGAIPPAISSPSPSMLGPSRGSPRRS